MFSKFSKRYFLILLLVCAGCITIPRSFHAVNYHKGRVYLTKNRSYKVGPLSADWKQVFPAKKAGIFFRNKKTGASITTEAICGAAFEDLPLPLLTEQLLMGLQEVKRIKEEKLMLSERGALYSIYTAKMDGVAIQINTLVVNKNGCEFDFWGVSRVEYSDSMSPDFDIFAKGFEY